jgi:S-adenosylmethionine synthetase
MARHVAKNLIAAGLAEKIELQVAYAIGVADPVSIMVDTMGTGTVDEGQMVKAIRDIFVLTPKGIIEYLDLRRPIFRKTAAYGHFGRTDPEFTWEKTNKAAELKAWFKR